MASVSLMKQALPQMRGCLSAQHSKAVYVLHARQTIEAAGSAEYRYDSVSGLLQAQWTLTCSDKLECWIHLQQELLCFE